jgi:hypothetical protein
VGRLFALSELLTFHFSPVFIGNSYGFNFLTPLLSKTSSSILLESQICTEQYLTFDIFAQPWWLQVINFGTFFFE